MMTLLWFLIGCINLPSSTVDTNNLTIEYEAIQEGEFLSLQARIRLSNQPSTFIVLSDGEHLSCQYNEIEYPLESVDGSSSIEYQTEFLMERDLQQISCSFFRHTGIESISTVSLPEIFPIEFPSTNSSLTQDDSITLYWQNDDSDDSLEISLNSSCFFEENVTVSFSEGRFTLPIEELNFFDLESNACNTNLIVDRHRSGVLSEDFASGYIQGIQRLRTSVLLRPQ